MQWEKLNNFIISLTQDDDGIEVSDKVVAAQLALDHVSDLITNVSEDYYIKTKEYSISGSEKQSFDLPNDYVMDVDCDYLYGGSYDQIQRLGRDNRYYDKLSGRGATWIDKNVNNRYSGDAMGYIIEIGKTDTTTQSKIVFYNSWLSQSINFNYFYEPTEIPDEDTLEDTFEIDIPYIAEFYYKWQVMKNLGITMNELESLMGIDMRAALKGLLMKLRKSNRKMKKNFGNFRNQFKQ